MVVVKSLDIGEIVNIVQEYFNAEVITSGETPLVLRVWKSEFDALDIDRLQKKLGFMFYWKSFETYFVLIMASVDNKN